MKIKETIGIDISKNDFDVCIYSNQASTKIINSNKGFNELLKWVFKSSSFKKENILFIFEHTGMYSHQLALFLTEKDLAFSMVPGLELKRSMGIVRGKNDRIDARKIALYGYRLKEELKPYIMPENSVIVIKNLFNLRTKLVRDRASYKTRMKEQARIYKKNENELLFKSQKKIIDSYTKQITAVQKEIDDIIKQDEQLFETHQLITSIVSVGKQTATAMIIYTSNFTKFQKSRQFASFSGIAPFPHESGTSINGRTRVSQLANKQMKYLLDMCALNAIKNNPEMKAYYERRIESGKNKLSTINVVRNKILGRIFAVVQRGTPYVNTMKYAA